LNPIKQLWYYSDSSSSAANWRSNFEKNSGKALEAMHLNASQCIAIDPGDHYDFEAFFRLQSSIEALT
jgi:hypothetical protein